MDDKVRLLKGGNTPSLSKEALRKFQDDLPNLIHFLQINAELIKAKYDALITQGFSETQALEICKGPLFNLG